MSLLHLAYALIGTTVLLSLIRSAERLAEALERPWARLRAWVNALFTYEDDVLL